MPTSTLQVKMFPYTFGIENVQLFWHMLLWNTMLDLSKLGCFFFSYTECYMLFGDKTVSSAKSNQKSLFWHLCCVTNKVFYFRIFINCFGCWVARKYLEQDLHVL